jgi:hypothetical protein
MADADLIESDIVTQALVVALRDGTPRGDPKCPKPTACVP